MLGAPLSPRRSAPRDDSSRAPLAAQSPPYSAFNVATYGREASTWSLLETARVERGPDHVKIGASSLERRGSRFEVQVHGPRLRGAPLRGRCLIEALSWRDDDAELDAGGRHRWRLVAPVARVEVDLQEPRTKWSGWGYVDSNVGDEPLHHAFSSWTWSRAHLLGGRSAVSYTTRGRDGTSMHTARLFEKDGRGRAIDLTSHPLATSGWRLPRTAYADAGAAPRIARSLEDTPFYARAMVDSTIACEPVRSIHETLSFDRLRSPWVRFLLPFRTRTESVP